MRLFKNSFLISILIFLMIIFQGCPMDIVCDSTINVVNNSNKNLQFYFGDSLQIPVESLQCDLTVLIRSFSTRAFCNWWQKKFTEEGIRTMHLYLFDKAVVDIVPWDTIRVNNMYLKRIDFTRATLDSLHWTLTYP